MLRQYAKKCLNFSKHFRIYDIFLCFVILYHFSMRAKVRFVEFLAAMPRKVG